MMSTSDSSSDRTNPRTLPKMRVCVCVCVHAKWDHPFLGAVLLFDFGIDRESRVQGA